MSSKEKTATAKSPKRAVTSPTKIPTLSKIVMTLMKSDLKESGKKKGMAIFSLSGTIGAKFGEKPPKHIMRAAIERGTRICVLQKPGSLPPASLAGSVKIHPKFKTVLEKRGVDGNKPFQVAKAITDFGKKRATSPEPEPTKPKSKAAASTKKPRADYPVAQKKKKQGDSAGAGTSKKRPAKSNEGEPKNKRAKK